MQTEIKLTELEVAQASRFYNELRTLQFSLDLTEHEIEHAEADLSMADLRVTHLKEKIAAMAKNKDILSQMMEAARNQLHKVFDQLKLRLDPETDLGAFQVGLDSQNNVVSLVKE
jgi:chromosome segregation ATPase